MAGIAKRRMRWLMGASLAATAGVVWLGVASWNAGPDWARAAALSPLAIRCLVLILGGMVVLGVLVAVMMHLRPESQHGHPRGFHGNQDGTAAIEFVLLLPVALMVFMIVTQSALLFNANMMVQYAAYSTVRVASTVLSMSIGSELRNVVNNPDGGAGSTKLDMLRRAAAMALVPISTGMDASSQDIGDSAGEAIRAETASVFSNLGKKERHWFGRIEKQYNYAWYYTHIDLAKPDHWRDGDPHGDCPYRHQERDEWTQWGWTYLPYCPFYTDRMDYYKWEDLHVRVIYQYVLEMPYAGRLMGSPTVVSGRKGTSYQTEIRATVSLMNEGGPDPQPQQQ